VILGKRLRHDNVDVLSNQLAFGRVSQDFGGRLQQQQLREHISLLCDMHTHRVRACDVCLELRSAVFAWQSAFACIKRFLQALAHLIQHLDEAICTNNENASGIILVLAFSQMLQCIAKCGPAELQ
jgi:hypothetical protein